MCNGFVKRQSELKHVALGSLIYLEKKLACQVKMTELRLDTRISLYHGNFFGSCFYETASVLTKKVGYA